MKFIQKIAIKMLWPKIKTFLIKHINSEETQKNYVDLINRKLDIPNLSEDAETKLLNQIYDAGQEALVEIVENFDIDKD